MSSRRLLVLLRFLPDDSEFKKALRDGDWSHQQYLDAGLLNEIRLLRVDQAALSGQSMDYSLLESPAQIEQRERDAERYRNVRTDILRQLHGGKE